MFCYIAYIKGVIANFVLKFPNFRYHGNEGHSRVNVNDTIKLHDLKNPLLGAKCFAISITII